MAQDIAVVIVPFPAHGHLNQLLNLSPLLFVRGLAVHYAASPSHIPPGQVPPRRLAARIRPRHPLPRPLHPSLPHLFPGPQRRHQIPQPPTAPLGIHSPPPLALLSSLCSVLSPPSNAASSSSTTPSSRSPPRRPPPSTTPRSTTSTASRPSSTSPGHPKKTRLARNQSISNASLISQSFDDCFTNEFLDFFNMNQALLDSVAAASSFINTCRPIEGELVDLLAEDPFYSGKNKLFTIGPLNHVSTPKEDSSRRHECLDWLDKQPTSSVVFVSFGMTSTYDARQADKRAGDRVAAQRTAVHMSLEGCQHRRHLRGVRGEPRKEIATSL